MIGWIDAASGASGDMLLGALLDAGADATLIQQAIAAVAPEAVTITAERVRRGALVANRAHVTVTESTNHRGLAEVRSLVDAAGLSDPVAAHSLAVFTLLAETEAAVHGTTTQEVHFHEVGALDAIADIVGVCTGLVDLGLAELHCSPVAVGTGTVSTAHGRLSVPPPAVASLLRGIATYAGPAETELCTPTGAALLRHWVTHWGGQPPMAVDTIGIGAGHKDFASHPNVVRLFVGRPATAEPATRDPRSEPAVVFETNVDDLDPRLWPLILQRLIAAGASDAWLTPILMKKGRPAHTLSVLMPPGNADGVRSVVFAETSAIGLRELSVAKHALERALSQIEVDGQPISVKLAVSDGRVVNVQPEYDDVAAAATALGRPVKSVLADAIANSADLWKRGHA